MFKSFATHFARSDQRVLDCGRGCRSLFSKRAAIDGNNAPADKLKTLMRDDLFDPRLNSDAKLPGSVWEKESSDRKLVVVCEAMSKPFGFGFKQSSRDLSQNAGAVSALAVGVDRAAV